MADLLGLEPNIVVRLYGPFPLPPEPESVVYLLAHSTDPVAGEPVKIGYSRNVRQRIDFLQAGSVHKLWLVTYLHGGKQLERELHEELAHCRIREDWFTMCDAVRESFATRRDEQWKTAA